MPKLDKKTIGLQEWERVSYSGNEVFEALEKSLSELREQPSPIEAGGCIELQRARRRVMGEEATRLE